MHCRVYVAFFQFIQLDFSFLQVSKENFASKNRESQELLFIFSEALQKQQPTTAKNGPQMQQS